MGAECTSCWMPFIGARARMMRQLQVRGGWRVTKKSMQKQEIYKISKRNLPNVGTAGWMEALAG